VTELTTVEPIIGTYFTLWLYDTSTGAYQLGPIIAAGIDGIDTLVSVDGVMIKDVTVSGMMMSWSSASGNSSSAELMFGLSTTFNGMTFSGVYASSRGKPSSIYGFATEPSASLSSWNGTYSCYETSGSSDESLGDLVIDGMKITFAGKAIVSPVYTGLSANDTDTTELAWFTTDGNENNVAISLFESTSDSGVLLFNGNIWAAGASRPEGAPASVNNFYGTTEADADINNEGAVDELAVDAQNQFQWADVFQVAANQAVQNQVNAEQEEEQEDVEEEAEEADADDDGGGDDFWEEMDEDVEEGEEVDEAGEDEEVPATGTPVSTPKRQRKASGLSAKQLLGMKDRT